MKQPTIYDVARLAGVSHQTVTRYLHGFEGIRPETRMRVEAALEKLEYRPNSAARDLRSRRNNRLGVLAHGLDQPGPARVIAGATAAARKRGFVLDIVSMDGDDGASVDEALSVVTEHQIAGILATAQTDAILDTLQSRTIGMPMVIDVRVRSAGDTVGINERSGRLAAQHLMDLGHRRVGYVSGPMSWFAAQSRMKGFDAVISAYGGSVVWRRNGDWSPESGQAAWSSLSQDEKSVTAIAAANDNMAIGVMSAAVRAGLDVPRDLSVVGTDDIPVSRFLLPSLSTVALDFESEGRYLVDTLMARISRDAESALSVTAPRLTPRESTRAI